MHPDQILQKVCHAIDTLIEAAKPHEGLFPSVLALDTRQMPDELPTPIPGQRNGDRSHPGCNLIHDEAILMTMVALGEALARHDYLAAVDQYLHHFATHCTDTVTGLFPWGEHAFWHLVEDRVAGNTHDHLRQAPLWLWQKLHQHNPQCIERFAEGLDYHWKGEAHSEYSRHASIMSETRQGWGARSCDFPRHSGFYIFDWAFAYGRTGRSDFLDQITHTLDYWWEKRDDQGLLLIESRSPETQERFYQVNAPGQTVSLATSLLESAALIASEEPALADKMCVRAATYIDGFFAAPHDLDSGVFVSLSKQGSGDLVESMPVWGSRYGVWPACYIALVCLCAYRMDQDERLLEWSRAVGNFYSQTFLPNDVAVPAMDAGLGLGLLIDLYDITADHAWLESGFTLTQQLTDAYLDHELPRGAVGFDWYESQMGPSFLLHGLSRLALMAMDKEHCPLAADYTAR